jgi:DNA-binding NtrC family response regulator
MEKQRKLLIVEDNEVILNLFSKFFMKKNYNVLTAVDGLDGLKLLESEKDGFDLIITDIVMPQVSGVGLISIVKKKYPDIPVIAITGFGKQPEMLAAEAHADLVLEKPVDLHKLDKYIDELLP